MRDDPLAPTGEDDTWIPSSTRAMVGPVCAHRLGFIAVVATVLLVFPGAFDHQLWSATVRGNTGAPPAGPADLAVKLSTWDAAHYLRIAAEGYPASGPELAFPPLWPTVISWVSPLAGGSALVAGLVLANLLAVVGALLLHAWVARTWDADRARWALALYLSFPGALFLGFAFSEALFVVLLAAILFLRERRPGLAALAGMALTLTRGVGVAVTLPLLWWGGATARRTGQARHLLPALGPALGYALSAAWMGALTGDPTAAATAQQGFIARSAVGDLVDPVGFARAFLDVGLHHDFLHAPIDRVWFLGSVVACVALARAGRKHVDLALLVAVLALVPAMTVKLMAFTRYALVILPAFAVFGGALSRRPRLGVAVVVVLALVQLVGVFRLVNHYWVG